MNNDKITLVISFCVLVVSIVILIFIAMNLEDEDEESKIDTHEHNEYILKTGDTMTGDLNIPSLYASGVIYGDGSGLQDMNASRISSGTIGSARLPSDINADTLDGYDSADFALATHMHDGRYYNKTEADANFLGSTGGIITGELSITKLHVIEMISGDGSGLTNLNAYNITMGTISIDRLPSNIDADTLDGMDSTDFITGIHNHDTRYYQKSEVDANFLNLNGGTLTGDLTLLNLYASGISGDGSGLTNLNASRITSGTIGTARLPPNLNADTLDSYDSTDFAMAIHDHDNRYYNKTASDAKFAEIDHTHNESELFGLVPIGSIIAWNKDIPGAPLLSDNFMECNGSVISDPDSPLFGQTVPDLNGENRFLRGNSASGSTGGSETHNHQWSKQAAGTNWIHCYGGVSTATTQSFNSVGTLTTLTYDGGTGLSGDWYTDNVDSKPPYFNIVWVMRIK
jgi:hypothetical protein